MYIYTRNAEEHATVCSTYAEDPHLRDLKIHHLLADRVCKNDTPVTQETAVLEI